MTLKAEVPAMQKCLFARNWRLCGPGPAGTESQRLDGKLPRAVGGGHTLGKCATQGKAAAKNKTPHKTLVGGGVCLPVCLSQCADISPAAVPSGPKRASKRCRSPALSITTCPLQNSVTGAPPVRDSLKPRNGIMIRRCFSKFERLVDIRSADDVLMGKA